MVVPCFNHGRFVADAVRSALRQEGADIRVVVVDDGSTDGTTPEACDACRLVTPDAHERVTVIHQENRGLSAARNAGARVVSQRDLGDYLVFLDADDYIEPTFVSRLHAELCTGAEGAGEVGEAGSGRVSHAYCQERLVDRAFGVWAVPEWDPVLLLITNLHPVTALVKRSCFEASGGFDESMREGYEDWEFWIRLSSLGYRGVRVREPLFNWRRHSPVTMVIEAVARHEQLVGKIMAKHAAVYQRHALELVRRSNALLRRADANWLDENLDAIVVRDLRQANVSLWQELERARSQTAAAEARAEQAEAAERQLRASYEEKPVIRVSRRVHRWLDSLPGPLSRAVKGTVRRAAGR